VKKGVEAERLVAKGYGEDIPRELTRNFKGLKSGRIFTKGLKMTDEVINGLKEKEGENAFEDAHTLNRRVTMKILREDFKSKRKPADEDKEPLEED
jgi:peptidoglycan-associated lipoprotein